MVTPRENFLNFLQGRHYDRMPSSLDRHRILPDIIPENTARGLILEQTPYTGPLGGKDFFGVDWVYEPEIRGSIETGALFEDIGDWELHVRFPDLSSFDWEGCSSRNREYLKTNLIIFSTIYTGYFERLISFVGFENAAIALVDEDRKQAVHRLFEKLTDFYIEYARLLHNYLNVEWIEFHDDWGNQRSLMFSAQTHREMIFPYVKRLYDAMHAEGIMIEQHSCGKIEELVPSIIESGADTWRGQPMNDKLSLVRRFGSTFRFGVEAFAETPLTDEEAISLVSHVVETYRNYPVWIFLPGEYTPYQLELIREMLRETPAAAF